MTRVTQFRLYFFLRVYDIFLLLGIPFRGKLFYFFNI